MSANLRDLDDRKDAEQWFICKRESGICEIVKSEDNDEEAIANSVESWGAFTSQGEAIAKRVGLIRAGKCQPI